MRNHKDLDVWKRSIDLVEKIYKKVDVFPKEEIYGITNQLKRASVSIPANISEGASRGSSKEFIRFLYIALGSASELETHLVIAEKLSLLSESGELFGEIEDIKKC